MDDVPYHSILDSLLDPLVRCFTPAVAADVAALRADPAAQDRIDELAEKANEGELSDAERREYAAYVEALDFVAVIQMKARAMLVGAGA